MPTGVYKHKTGHHPSTEFKKGHKINLGRKKNLLTHYTQGAKGKHWKMSDIGKENIRQSVLKRTNRRISIIMNQYKDNCRKYLGFYEAVTIDKTTANNPSSKVVIRIPDTDEPDKLKIFSSQINKMCIGIPLCYISDDVKKYYVMVKDEKKKLITVYSLSGNKLKNLKANSDYVIQTYAEYLGPQYEINIAEWQVSLRLPVELFNDIFFLWRKHKPNNHQKWVDLLSV